MDGKSKHHKASDTLRQGTNMSQEQIAIFQPNQVE